MKKLCLIMICSFAAMNHAMNIEVLAPDTLLSIFRLTHPIIDLKYSQIATPLKKDRSCYTKEEWMRKQMRIKYLEKSKISQKDDAVNIQAVQKTLPTIATTLMHLRGVNRQFNKVISENIALYLGLDADNMDAFLIRSTQANIPYFMKVALKHNADPNFVHQPDNSRPLVYTTANRCLPACTLLLNNGAHANTAKTLPSFMVLNNGTTSFDRDCPIFIALDNHDHKLVALFLEKGAQLDCMVTIDEKSYTSLLAIAAYNTDSDCLAIIMNAHKKTIQKKYHKLCGYRKIIKSAYNLIITKTGTRHNKDSDTFKCLTLLKNEVDATKTKTKSVETNDGQIYFYS